MKLCVLLLASAALVSDAVHSDSGAKSAPINKVVEMLGAMLVKGRQFKQEEKVEFAKFSTYCDMTRTDTTKAIENGGDSIVQLKATIGKSLSDAEVLAEDIKEQQGEVAREEAELDTAKKLRAKERAHYELAHKDFTESIEAITKATEVIKSKSKDVPQSLLQLQRSNLIPAEVKASITSLIALSDSTEEEGPPNPKALAYESQTGGITVILEKLKLKFEDQKTTLEKEESNTKANFNLLEQKLTDSIEDGKKTISEKTVAKAKKQETAGEAKGDLDVTKAAKVADEKKLDDLTTECDAASKEFEKNQVTRGEEIKAMETCVKILGSEEVSGTADKHNMAAASLLETATSLAQLRQGESSQETDKRRKLVMMLEHKAKKLGSKYLSLVAARALTDPMLKVKKMIKDLVVKLMEEATSEADQKGYCDTELATNKVTRNGKSSDVEELSANVEKLTADLAQMAEEISELSKELSEIKSEQKKATELRDEEKALNTKTIEEAKGAQLAVERATQVMKDFYAKAAKNDAFIQDSSSDEAEDSVGDDMKEAASEPYQGMQASSGGIIGMLEVILSDFARLESSASSAEDEAQTTYKNFMDSSNQDAAVKGVEMEHLEGKSETSTETNRNLKKELSATQAELDTAIEYYEKLKPDCVDTGLSYQDRIEMRQAEIQSLQEALKVLDDQ